MDQVHRLRAQKWRVNEDFRKQWKNTLLEDGGIKKATRAEGSNDQAPGEEV